MVHDVEMSEEVRRSVRVDCLEVKVLKREKNRDDGRDFHLSSIVGIGHTMSERTRYKSRFTDVEGQNGVTLTDRLLGRECLNMLSDSQS